MNPHLPGGDPRFGPPEPAPLTSPAAPPATTRFGAVPAGRANATPPTRAVQRRATGTPHWLVASAFGVVVLLVLTGALIWQHQSKADAAKRRVFEHTRVSTPAAVIGLQQGVGPGMESAQTRLNLALAKGGAVDPVYAAYLDADGNSYAVVAGARRVTEPSDLDAAARSIAEQFSSGIGSAGSTPFTVSETPSGQLGGVMLCGATTIAQLPSTYCVAVDEGSVTEFLIATGNPDQGSAAASNLRSAMVTRTS